MNTINCTSCGKEIELSESPQNVKKDFFGVVAFRANSKAGPSVLGASYRPLLIFR